MRKVLRVAVPLLVIGFLFSGGYTVYHAYTSKKHSSITATTQRIRKRNPKIHDFMDADFAKKMLLYHQLAQQLDDIAKLNATHVEVRQFAEQDSAYESVQANLYSNLLQSWDESYMSLTDFPELNGCFGYPTFAGMLPHAEVRAYRVSSGDEVDKQFLRLLITHHKDLTALINQNGRSIGFGKILEARDNTLKVQAPEIKRLGAMLASVGS